ncbi:MAG TPA: ATP synthase F1 subunit delta, partial [Thermoanaerobaculia bacterium]
MSSFTRPYARAFVESAPKGYDYGAFESAMTTLEQALESNSKLRAFLRAPNVPREAKSNVVVELSRRVHLDDFGSRFLQVMLRNHRLLETGQVLKALRDLLDAREGILRVQVTVPAAPSEAEQKLIEEAVAARTGKRVRMQIGLDPKILGGFIARAGSQV